MKTAALSLFSILSIFLLLFSGCLSKPDYSYESVQQEYADTLCRIAPLAEKEEASDTCAIAAPISLAQAIEIALSNNPDNRMPAARIEQAEADIEAANAAFYPGLSFYTEYTEGDAPSAYLFKKIDQRALPPPDISKPRGLQNRTFQWICELSLHCSSHTAELLSTPLNI